MRNYVDPAGVAWTVREYIPECGASLIFVSAEAMRRVQDYPNNWHVLPAAELMRLSWARGSAREQTKNGTGPSNRRALMRML